jgi:hypothetical protein
MTGERIRPMRSTQIATRNGRPVYVVHAPDAPVPDRAPACRPGCALCVRQERP